MSETSGAEPVRFIMIGGFLGAGKTTTLLRVAQRLSAAGQRVALITNDQAGDLVDTEFARRHGLPVEEIAGGCFCCRFNDLMKACDQILSAVRPDVLLSEPVGSCADLAATVLQPLRRFYGERFALAPYTVLADPERVETHLLGRLADTPVGYLFRKQLEEADILALNKADTLEPEQCQRLLAGLRRELPATDRVAFSALTGGGVDDWWAMLGEGRVAGQRILEIDYDAYADAEAALGWLNASVELAGEVPFDGTQFASDLMAELRREVGRVAAEIGHVKLLLEARGAGSEGAVRANLTRTAGQAELAGGLAQPLSAAHLTLNARVELAPEQLEPMVVRALRRVANACGVEPRITRLQSFRPARPQPTYREGG